MITGGSETDTIGVINNENARLEEIVAELQHGLQVGDTDGTKAEGKDDTIQDESKYDTHQEERTLTVKTKTEDGGSQASKRHRSDAFSQYSNTNVRMMHLLGLDDTEEANEDNTDWQQLTGYQGLKRPREGGADQDGNARNTRLSTELHDSAFHEQLFGGNPVVLSCLGRMVLTRMI